MSREVRLFPITIPAGTLPSAPQTTAMNFPAREVDKIEVQVPPGPRGEVGFRIAASGVQLIPLDLGTWLVTDDEVVHVDTDGYHDSGSWQLVAYNTGQFPHTLTPRFYLSLPGSQKGGATTLVASDALGVAPVSAGGLTGPPPVPSLPPPPGLPALPPIIPPIIPPLVLPGRLQETRDWSERAKSVLFAVYGGERHVFYVDNGGRLAHARGTHALRTERLEWAQGLVPGAWLAGALAGGQAHVFAPLQGGGILHLAQPAEGGDVASWGGEILGGAV